MGSFYSNITLRTAQQSAAIDALRSAGREALVAQPTNGCTVVYDRETDENQDVEGLTELAGSLSAKLRCAALAVVIHDDDVFAFTLHENGKLTDEYVSWPAFMNDSGSDSPEGGDAAALCKSFGAESSVAKVEEILRTNRAGGSDQGYVFETERHEALVKALGLPEIAVSTGFNYIEDGELPEGTSEDSFTRVA